MFKLVILLLCATSVLCCYPGFDLRDPDLVPGKKRVNPNSYCKDYEQSFYHYCSNINRRSDTFRDTLYDYCAGYIDFCRPDASIRRPGGGGPWPNPTNGRGTTCTWGCTAPHCTVQCKCRYYEYEAIEKCVNYPIEFSDVTFFERNCGSWWNQCNAVLPRNIRKQIIDVWGPVINQIESKPIDLSP